MLPNPTMASDFRLVPLNDGAWHKKGSRARTPEASLLLELS